MQLSSPLQVLRQNVRRYWCPTELISVVESAYFELGKLDELAKTNIEEIPIDPLWLNLEKISQYLELSLVCCNEKPNES